MEKNVIKSKTFQQSRKWDSSLNRLQLNLHSDLLYNFLILKIFNNLTKHGKHQISEKVLKMILYKVQQKMKGKSEYTLYVLLYAIKNLMPMVEVTKHELYQRSYYVPSLVLSDKQKLIKALKILFKLQPNQISQEIWDLFHKRGRLYKQRLELNELAYKNRAFTHYRWIL